MSPTYPLIFIVGPTASGKTDVAVELARRISADIISCDSMLAYKEPKILVNKPDAGFLNQIRHYMIDIVSVEEEFDVYRFKKEVDIILENNYPKRNLVFVGGSGLYVKILLDGIFEGGSSSKDIREALIKEAEQGGIAILYQKLREVDGETAAKVNPNDLRRIVRGLEVYYLCKKPISERQREAQGYYRRFPTVVFGLKLNRALLYEKINKRTEEMFERGVVEEVRKILKLSLSKTAQGILGIKEIKEYLNGNCTKERSLEELKKNTRRFAKRQLTWFRKEERIKWIDIEGRDTSDIVAEIINQCG